jgi:hypothetical protein
LRKGLDRHQRIADSWDMLAAKSVQNVARSSNACFSRKVSCAVRS